MPRKSSKPRQLTWLQSEYVRNTQRGGPLAFVSGASLAKKLGVSEATISKIREGRTYATPKAEEVEIPDMYYKIMPTFKCKTPTQWPIFLTANGHHETPISHEVAPLSFDQMKALRRVNEYINQFIKYTHDGGKDTWREFQVFDKDIRAILDGKDAPFIPGYERVKGDCEDYAFTKRRALAPWLGYGALSPCILDFSNATKHMVLSVHCQDQTIILDNFADNVMQLSPHHKPIVIYRNGAWQYAVAYAPQQVKDQLA